MTPAELEWANRKYLSWTVRVLPLSEGGWAVGGVGCQLAGIAHTPEELIALIAATSQPHKPGPQPVQQLLPLGDFELRI